MHGYEVVNGRVFEKGAGESGLMECWVSHGLELWNKIGIRWMLTIENCCKYGVKFYWVWRKGYVIVIIGCRNVLRLSQGFS